MNIAFTPEAVAAEIEYRFETGRVHSAPAAAPRHRRPVVGPWLRRIARHGSPRHTAQRA